MSSNDSVMAMDTGGTPELKQNLILGIDPGKHGALALYDPEKRECVALIDMPKVKNPVSGRPQVCSFEIAAFIALWAPRIDFAVIEDVHSMPENGVVSMFNFGMSKGVLAGVCGALLVPVEYVAPNVWKALMKLTKEKKHSIERAAAMFPESAHYFKREKSDDGRAEALLLGVYGSLYCKEPSKRSIYIKDSKAETPEEKA